MDRAWRQVKKADTPEVIEENLEWVMLDKDFEDKMTETMEGRYVWAPMWYRAYGGRTVGTTSGAEAGPAVPVVLPGSQFAHDIVSGFETGANNIVGDVVSFSEGVTNVTNPPPPPSSSSWGGGGGGCACACACAGCACACAGGGA